MGKADFFNLSSYFWLEMLNIWLEARDIARLDSAVMNMKQRRVFLTLLQDPFFVLSEKETNPRISYISWLGDRAIKMRRMSLSLQHLKGNCDQLERLNVSKLESLSFISSGTRTNGSASSATNEMTILQMLWHYAVKSDPCQKLFVRCTNLKHVDFGSEYEASFGKIGMFCSKLKSIRAVDCAGLNDTAIESIAQHCRDNLQTIILRTCDKLTSASVYAIASNCKNVKFIDLSYGSSLSERSLIQLAEQCPLLENINFEGLQTISDRVIAAVAANCKNLQYFNIDYYKGMSHEGIDPVALKLIAESCTQICDFIAPEFNYKVREGKATLKLKGIYLRLPKLRNILNNSPEQISELIVSNCKYFNDDCLTIATEKYRNNLHTLTVNGCEDLTDAGFSRIAMFSSELHTLDASCCNGITNAGIMVVALQCGHLHTVYVKKCPHLTDQGLISLCCHTGTRLSKLDVSNNPALTDAVLQAICLYNAELRVLDVTGCEALSREAVIKVASACVHIEHLCFKHKILY